MGPKMCALAGARLRRRLLQLDDPRVRRPARRNVEGGAGDVPRDAAARVRLRADRGRRRRAPSGWRRRRPSTATSTTATATTSHRLGEPQGTVGVAAADRDAGPVASSPPTTALDVTVVRGLASAHRRGDDRGRGGRRAMTARAARCSGSLAAFAALAFATAAGRGAEAAARPSRAAGSLDADGRVVILHGVNMVYKVGSYRPAAAGFGARRRPLPRPPRLQHRPPGDHLQGPGAEAAVGRRPAPLPPRLHPQHREDRAVLARRGIFSLLDFHQDLYNERFQGEGWPDWRCSTTASRPSRRPAFPPTTWSTPASTAPSTTSGPTRRSEGRGLQDRYAAAWRRVATQASTVARTSPATTCSTSPGPASAFQRDNCLNTAGCPASTRRPWRRSTPA